ncbi:MAG: hypothetical protein ABW007_14525 [Chitinophagaceae bacterium]
MTAITISRKILKVTAIIVAIVAGILVSFHFWFITLAEDLLSDLVTKQSNGKLALEVEKFRFNWFKKKMELRSAVFYTTNDSSSTKGYRIEVGQLQLRLKSLYSVIADKKFLIDSLNLINPTITVTNLHAPDSIDTAKQEHASLAQEMGKVYNSIREAMKVLEVDRFVIGNGRFVLVNKVNPLPDAMPVVVSNIHLRLDNFRIDSAGGTSQQKILFSDNVALQTTNQDIHFPDGRHRLSFRNFRINLQNRLAEFDSCTITARKGDSDSSSFTVFFDKLKMTNIDFDTLYRAEVIKADSVYCVNPQFRLNINLKEKTLNAAPKLDEILLQLAGNLHLKFAVVENGSFDINIKRRGHPSSFISDHNNFEVAGLRVHRSSPKPVTVERFAMAIRNYENFLRDSSLSIQFDSILLYNNRVSLANFVFREYKSGNANNRVGMPQFELYGLSWDDLVFSRNVKAEQLVLYKPVINYTIKPKKGKTADVFHAFAEVNRLLQLNNLNIIDGQVNLDFANNAQLKLENVTSFVSAKQLVKSRNIANIRAAVNTLMFTDGHFTMNDLRMHIRNAVLSNNGNEVQAASVIIHQKNKLDIQANNILINSVLIDEAKRLVTVNDIKWSSADIKIRDGKRNSSKELQPFVINRIKGQNTKVSVQSGQQDISFFIQEINANQLSNEGNRWTTQKLNISGNNLTGKQGRNLLSIHQFKLADGLPSQLQNVLYRFHSNMDSILVKIPLIRSIADISGIIEGRFNIQSVDITQPDIHAHFVNREEDADEPELSPWPKFQVEQLKMQHPLISITMHSPKGNSRFEWKGKENNYVEVQKLATDSSEAQGMKAGRIAFILDGLIFTNSKGKTFHTKRGDLNAWLENVYIRRNDAGAWDWKGKLGNLTANHFAFDSLDKLGGRLEVESARLGNLYVSSSLLLNMYELVKRNTSFTLKETTGIYQNKQNRFSWNNLRFDKTTHELQLDSFSYIPMQTQEEFMRTHPYQKDYATLRTGPVSIGRVNIERYLKDTIVDLGSITVNDVQMEDFRDKRMPRAPGEIKPLPVKHLAKLPVRLNVDSVQLDNANIKYGEYNEKTQAAGWIHVNRLNALLTNVRNHGTTESDSIAIHATAYLEDSLFTALQLKGSYTDKLQGFVMKVQMGKADLRVLNDAVGPLAGASLKSGVLDTMTMLVRGNDNVAYGEMLMVYHDLKVSIAGKPQQEKKSFLKGVINSIVNTVLRNKNTDRKGVVFFARLQDRSALNYLVKITLSGVGSSAGLGKNKRQLKRYLRREAKAVRTTHK